MEKTTLLSGNGRPYEREIPKVVITSHFNDVALENLRKQTGIDFQRNVHGSVEGQPETWEQFIKIFLCYNFIAQGQNNADGNYMYLRYANVPFGNRLYYEQDGKKFIGVDGWK